MNINREEAKKQLEKLQKDVDNLKVIINTSDYRDWKQLTNFEKCCEANGDSACQMISKWGIVGHTESQIAGFKLEYCIKTINQGWKPDWSNTNERKWYNWFGYKGSHGEWFLPGTDYYCSCSCISGGFFYQTEEKARHGAKYFLEYYKIWLGE